MKLLLDTHIALWWVTGDASLSGDVVAMIEAAEHDVYVSVASIWEIAIKYARPKGRPDDMPLSGREALAEFERAGADILPVTAAHAAAVDDLPALHGDPFDRMLIAQALTEPLRFLTRDARLAGYSESVMLA